jgi:hypothetical protein
MKTAVRRLAVLAALAFLAAPAAAEDLTVAFKTTGPGASGTSRQYYSSERMRSTDGEHDMIFEYASGRIVTVDHKKKEYSETTLAEIEEAMKAASAQMAQMRQQMESMPPAMREKMEQMMGGGEVTVTKGGTREIAGYKMDLWNTTGLKLPVPAVDLRKLASFTGPMAAMAGNPMFKGFSQLAEKMKEIPGFTLADDTSMKMMGRGFETSREATEVKAGPIPASDFDVAVIAKGYKKVPSPLTRMGRRK